MIILIEQLPKKNEEIERISINNRKILEPNRRLIDSFLSIDNYNSTNFEVPAQKHRTSLLNMSDMKGRIRSIDIYDICITHFESVMREGKKSIVLFDLTDKVMMK